MKVLVIGGGIALLAVGALLLIPLPEAGLPAVLLGLRLLGRHYGWARRANDKLDHIAAACRRRWTRLPGLLRRLVLSALLGATVFIVYALVK